MSSYFSAASSFSRPDIVKMSNGLTIPSSMASAILYVYITGPRNSVTLRLASVRDTGESRGRVILGNYGEGKTHLLNTVFSMASNAGMAVSMISLSKETLANNLQVLYQKLIENTYLPGQVQPSFMHKVENLQLGSDKTKSLLLYSAVDLQTDRLHYVLKDFIASRDSDDHTVFENDIEGKLCTVGQIRQAHARFFGQKAEFKVAFDRNKDFFDYFGFISHLLKTIGCTGWVILFDEAELMGRISRKTRRKAYLNMAKFLNPPHSLDSVYTMYAFASSYIEDVITSRDEYEAIEMSEEPDDVKATIKSMLDRICAGDELARLSDEELYAAVKDIAELHTMAFGTERVDIDELFSVSDRAGYLLRTKVRAAIEYLDQVLQYGDAAAISSGKVDQENMEDTLQTLFPAGGAERI